MILQIWRKTIQFLGIFLVITAFLINSEVTLTVLLISAIILGPFYCGWLCPFGLLQDIMTLIRKKMRIKKIHIPTQIKAILNPIRYIVYILTILFSSNFIYQILSLDSKTNLDLVLTNKWPTVMALFLLLMFTISSIFIERVYCNYFCVTGAKYGIFSYFKIFSISRSEDTCVNCKACDNVCPMDITVSKIEILKTTKCINCFECKSACPINDTVEYKLIDLKNNRNKFVFALLVFSIMVGYNILINTSSHSQEQPYLVEETDYFRQTPHSRHQKESSQVITDEYNDSVKVIANGTYTGIGIGFRGEMVVDVTVNNGMITKIEVVAHKEDRKWFNAAYPYVTSNILESQSTDIDTLTGATYSSKGIIDGVVDALNKAKNP